MHDVIQTLYTEENYPVWLKWRVQSFHLVHISLADNKDEIAVFLHHSAVLYDTLHPHSNLLAPGGTRGEQGHRLQNLLPQQPVLCVWREDKVMQEEAGLIC